MINSFSLKDTLRYSLERSPQLDMVYKYMHLDYKIVHAYYQNRDARISNTNILVRLINKLSIDINKDIFDYLELLDIDYKYKAKSLDITSELHRGKIFNNILGDTTVLIDNSFLSPFEVEDYKNVSAIKVLYSNDTDLSMNHPSLYTKGNFVLMIDILAIMVQYRQWSLDRLQNNMSTSPNIFVFQVLYTNMIKDLLEFSLYNRFFSNIFTEQSTAKHPFNVRNHDDKVNKIFLKLSEKLERKTLRYTQFLQYIPLPFNKDAYDLLSYGVIDINHQNIWAIFYARIEIMLNIIFFLGHKSVARNKDLLIDFRLFMKVIRFNRILETVAWNELEPYIEILYNRALEVSKNRGL